MEILHYLVHLGVRAAVIFLLLVLYLCVASQQGCWALVACHPHEEERQAFEEYQQCWMSVHYDGSLWKPCLDMLKKPRPKAPDDGR